MEFEPLNIENEVMDFDIGSGEEEEEEDDVDVHIDDIQHPDYNGDEYVDGDYEDDDMSMMIQASIGTDFEAIKYVDEGAKSSHVYSVAMDALKEAAKKVAAAKKQGAGLRLVGSHMNGSNQDVHVREADRLDPLQLSSTVSSIPQTIY
ncbi:hypothetical protein FRX31_028502 [Thalictrum thalictroides]|uniref:Uncharacterized protein n=1 Tax=Thalictrum thalictroides TaxID=46969 RepID=A0A7J6VB86_THATH|nr:hypothetical protein FRX31_028502 [Thalictrum thalictroides]